MGASVLERKKKLCEKGGNITRNKRKDSVELPREKGLMKSLSRGRDETKVTRLNIRNPCLGQKRVWFAMVRDEDDDDDSGMRRTNG